MLEDFPWKQVVFRRIFVQYIIGYYENMRFRRLIEFLWNVPEEQKNKSAINIFDLL